MKLYPLTERQKIMIRSLEIHFNSDQPTTEILILHAYGKIDLIHGIHPSCLPSWENVTDADFSTFVRCGFMSVEGSNKFGKSDRFALREYEILEAIKHDFMISEPTPVLTGVQVSFDGANITGSNLNIASTLNDVHQQIQNAPALSDDFKAQISQLLQQLREEMAQVPADYADDVEILAEQTNQLAQELSAEKPRLKKAIITAEGLKKAAENLVSVVPYAVKIATRIVEVIEILAKPGA